MSSSAGSAGADAANSLKKGLTGIHGAGEAIRGNINQFIDGAFNDKQGVAKNQSVADRGVREVESGHYQSHNAGVTPADTTREKLHDGGATTHAHGAAGLGSSTAGTSTNAGPHSSNLANKLDPSVDSDLDGRAARSTRATGI
ncbi:hypothetical protein LPUS_05713 [Lasallia pustulata]|uniref:Uncharacterized protein n=1 Tax=Lasallia pustulata TaxID=136370 RepID=A0A1W5CZF3_9LECA|nr:hypothetical protein LPUS_05713 [Lasallia pustulata]